MELGHLARFVPPNIPSHALLPKYIYDVVETLYSQNGNAECDKVDDFCTLAIASLAWGDFHHSLRQLVPTKHWTNVKIFKFLCKRLSSFVPEDPTLLFDVRNVHQDRGRMVHLRTFAVCEMYAIHYVWAFETSTKDLTDAALRAAFHPRFLCKLINLLSGEEITVRCRNPKKFYEQRMSHNKNRKSVVHIIGRKIALSINRPYVHYEHNPKLLTVCTLSK